MRSIQLGGSVLEASQIALGIMRMGSKGVDEAAEIISTVYDNGVNFFDSADIYQDGKSERVFAEAFKKTGLKREDVLLQSKGGIVLDPSRTTPDGLVFGQRFEFSKKHLIESVEGILERLQTDYLDVFLLHRPDPLMEPEEVAAAFNELQNSGKVRHFGVSNFNRSQVELVQEAVSQRLIINQLQFGIKHTPMIDAGLYVNRFENDGITRDGGGLLEFCHRTNMTIQAWSPYQYGMFEGIFLDNPQFPELNAKLEELAQKYGTNKSAIATAWITRMPQGIQVILGSMNPQHLVESIEGVDITLEYQDWYDLYFAAGHLLP